MEADKDFAAAFENARRLHAAGKFAEAEMAYRRLADDSSHRETVLQALFDLYVHAGRPQQAAETLMELMTGSDLSSTKTLRAASFNRVPAQLSQP